MLLWLLNFIRNAKQVPGVELLRGFHTKA